MSLLVAILNHVDIDACMNENTISPNLHRMHIVVNMQLVRSVLIKRVTRVRLVASSNVDPFAI